MHSVRSYSKVCMASSTHSLATAKVEKKAYHPAKEAVGFRRTHSLPPEKLEIFKSLESWATDNILVLLNHVERSWEPQDFLPTSESEEGFFEQVKELRERSKEIPDDCFDQLVGNMVTEEALPTYQTEYLIFIIFLFFSSRIYIFFNYP
ncbi:Plant stearoyl-acyl-carrier-protein desaturase family protein, putative [Theobroma cacao]|uniref:stearoyl-[acyl-carrier-protein] 9-desaturase n=1 Tax=Theobroma cacao TaxID=3641 RepID=A0A061DJV4_THECC|nr:Plant stearoyl-acyl-carrier-protein desaturase family protein, putative [Theobroma cacao]